MIAEVRPDLSAVPKLINYPRLIRRCSEPAKVEEVVAASGSGIRKGLGQGEHGAGTWLRFMEQRCGAHSVAKVVEEKSSAFESGVSRINIYQSALFTHTAP